MKIDLDLNGLIAEIGKCCLGERCTSCKREQCLIGYCKKSLTSILKQRDEFITDGMNQIPLKDTKIYEDETIVETLGFLLHQCRNCNVYHDDECIINIIRSSLEIILFGEVQEYKGSTLLYLTEIKSSNPQIAEKVFTAFQARKK
jgi:hypothetical protein